MTMTGSWTLDLFVLGSIILIVIPAAVVLKREVFKRGDHNQL